MPQARTLPVITIDEEPVAGEKGLFSAAQRASGHVGALDPNVVAGNLTSLCEQLSDMVDAAAAAASGAFELDCFEVSLDISARGEVRLIGSVSSEIRGGMTLTFRRRP
ncbi:MAG TPA: hypothetical protein VF062_15740 [Candidatus Limnocylindrales bacterium]